MPNRITISGFKEFSDKCQKLATQFPQEFDEAAKFAAATWSQLASRDAPKDFGKLAGNISPSQEKVGVWDVNSPKEYSPYMEWGTKSRAVVPAELQSYASQFKGKGVSLGRFVLQRMLYEWMDRVGIPEEAQWVAYINIVVRGVKPHPFFFKQRPIVEKQLLSDLHQIIETID